MTLSRDISVVVCKPPDLASLGVTFKGSVIATGASIQIDFNAADSLDKQILLSGVKNVDPVECVTQYSLEVDGSGTQDYF